MKAGRRYSSWLAALFVALASLMALSPVSAGAGDSGRIAFTKGKQIFTIDSTGDRLVRLTDTRSYNWMPAWSPDGSKIAFICRGWPRRNGELCIMRSDGSGLRRLTRSSAAETTPTWSPNGKKIAFVRSDETGSRIIVRSPARGAVESEAFWFPTVLGSLSWSPAGNEFLLTAQGVGGIRNDVYTLDTDGTDLTNLTMSTASESSASWSPDGKKIVFDRNEEWSWILYTMDASGEDIRSLEVDGGKPSWSPDGRLIAFADLDEDKQAYELGVVRPDGSRPRIILTSEKPIRSPAWRP